MNRESSGTLQSTETASKGVVFSTRDTPANVLLNCRMKFVVSGTNCYDFNFSGDLGVLLL